MSLAGKSSPEPRYHIALSPTDAADYVLLPGDPGRCEAIARRLDNPSFVAANREYTTWRGNLEGERVLVTSTGIGGPSAVIALEELYDIGCKSFIRVGTCGGIDLGVRGGDIVIATGAVRQEGTALHYAPPEYPAVADFGLCRCLADAAQKLGHPCHAGVVQCKDSFYGQHDPSRMPVAEELKYKWKAWKRLHVLASEMESAALFVASVALGTRCAAVFSVVWNQERAAEGLDDTPCHDPSRAIETAVEALRMVISYDREKNLKGTEV